jgi:hypothetical protein
MSYSLLGPNTHWSTFPHPLQAFLLSLASANHDTILNFYEVNACIFPIWMRSCSICLSVADFSLPNDLQFYSCQKWQYFILLLLNSILLCIYATFSISIYQLIDTSIISISWLLWLVLQRSWECSCLPHIDFISLSTQPVVGLLSHMEVSFFIFWMIVLIYITIKSAQGFPFLYILTSTCSPLSFW